MWECSYCLSEMQDYIAKMRGASDTSDKEDREPMDTTDGGREEEEQGEGLQESSDEGDSGRPILKKPKVANICYWTKKHKYDYSPTFHKFLRYYSFSYFISPPKIPPVGTYFPRSTPE